MFYIPHRDRESIPWGRGDKCVTGNRMDSMRLSLIPKYSIYAGLLIHTTATFTKKGELDKVGVKI